MFRYILVKEFFKTTILTLVIFLSIAQIGMLWSYQNYGIPFRFFQDMFGTKIVNSFITIKKHKEDFIMPKRIVVSNKLEQSYWSITEENEIYKLMWKEARSYLIRILNYSDLQSGIEVISKNIWGELLKEQIIMYEFEARYDQNTFRTLLNLAESNSEKPKGLYKIIISPDDRSERKGDNNSNNIDNDKIYMYILDKHDLYKVKLNIGYKNKPKSWYNYIVRYCTEKKLKKYKLANKYFSDEAIDLFNVKDDVLISLKEDEGKKINSVEIQIPSKVTNINSMSKEVLGNELEKYVTYISNDKSIIFQNLNSNYKISKNGCLNYRLKGGGRKTDKGSESIALEKALDFLEKMKKIISITDAKIVLSNIKEDYNSFNFEFDYKVAGLPVLLQDKYKIKKAINIKANEKSVLECEWIIRSFKIQENYKLYNEFFITLINNENFISNRKISSIYLAFDGLYKEKGSIKPFWIVKDDNGELNSYPMNEK